jgi:hypothetical protein
MDRRQMPHTARRSSQRGGGDFAGAEGTRRFASLRGLGVARDGSSDAARDRRIMPARTTPLSRCGNPAAAVHVPGYRPFSRRHTK